MTPEQWDALDEFTQGYLECALWASPGTDEEGELDELYTLDDLCDSALARCRAECQRFQTENAADLNSAEEAGCARDHLGHDLFLSRNRHGTGFWDRGLGHLGDRLQAAAEAFGPSNLFANDDGSLDLLEG